MRFFSAHPRSVSIFWGCWSVRLSTIHVLKGAFYLPLFFPLSTILIRCVVFPYTLNLLSIQIGLPVIVEVLWN